MNTTVDLTPRIVTLGTAGGPRWWASKNGEHRHGIATAVVVGDVFYLVDAGLGVGRQLEKAGLSFNQMRAMFITHLHSDHTVDIPSLLLMGLYERDVAGLAPIRVLGPGDRGALPPVSPRAEIAPQPVCPENPTPGITGLIDSVVQAFATDFNDRILDALRPSPLDCYQATDIVIPADIGYHPNDNPTPAGMAPFEIYRDELVTVTAILVEHPPVAPAFAFRFDTAEGSVTISGDTTATDNLVTLAKDTDLLLHEAIDFDWVAARYGSSDAEADQASIDHHRRSHTSPEQAIELAERAGAARLALHHLVPGSKTEAQWQEFAPTFSGEFLIPNDLDSISFARKEAAIETTPIKVGA
ncbi:MBL fold metallo-hydrolase [Gulosibacter chungangensis]|uniref:MBL fold metallo-hydrolase n=1 Tax=Gulosibacter chungangensis TaxID=979746 RepID=A0A7J5B967_9MICO|nr:MBL fold metallo-hydrolase [Gulosibacter chungangensis]KAB1641928.1 MBL fold metallo-hydrolase [Gulosibacter chungangensis]